MAINPGDLKAIEDAPTAVDSVIAVVNWLRANHTIDANVQGIVVLGIENSRKVLEPAIQANVHN